MSYHISHQFLNAAPPAAIRILIIGTFNPGKPCDNLMTPQERLAFARHLEKCGSQQFDLLNFYDRPQNRFWGVLERMHMRALQQRNVHGAAAAPLKYYKRHGNRRSIRQNQGNFCEAQSICITDLVSKVIATDLDAVYKNFSDAAIDGLVPADGWNTDAIIALIEDRQPATVLFTFQPNEQQIPNITAELRRIQAVFPAVAFLPSPSGAARPRYADLVPAYEALLPLI